MNKNIGRFIFHNPHHYHWFKKPSSLGFGKKNVQKYTYLLEHYMNMNEKVFVFIDSYKDKSPWYSFKQNLHPVFGFYAWVFRNKMNPFKFRVILNPTKIYKDDKLLIFLFGTFTNESGVISNQRIKSNLILKEIKAFKIVHCTHYMYHADIASTNLKIIDPDLLVAENNLKKNSEFFQNIFKWYAKNFYLLPFVPNERFDKVKQFENRINKAFAMGSIVEPIQSKIFNDCFPGGVLQPMRVSIRENQNAYNKYIYSIISYINDPIEKGKAYQQNYFNKNIVELYNDYTMLIVPEEVSGLPGIGFAEGMRCGAAFIGLDDPMYKDIGMIPGTHYIAYDGTIRGLVDKISYYQNHEAELSTIAQNGYQFACDMLNPNKVTKNFFEYINYRSQIKGCL